MYTQALNSHLSEVLQSLSHIHMTPTHIEVETISSISESAPYQELSLPTHHTPRPPNTHTTKVTSIQTLLSID